MTTTTQSDLHDALTAARARKTNAEADAAAAAAAQVRILTKEAETAQERENASDSRHGVYWVGEIEEDRSRMMVTELNMQHRLDPKSSITVYINSGGGEVMGGFILHDHLRYMSALGHQVTTIATGACMSMAVPVWCAGDEGRRLIAANCTFMLHEVQFGGLPDGSLSDIADVDRFGRLLYERMLSVLADTSDLTVRKLKAMIGGRERFYSADDMVKFGFGRVLSGTDPLAVR